MRHCVTAIPVSRDLSKSIDLSSSFVNVDNLIDEFMSDWFTSNTPKNPQKASNYPRVDIDETDEKLTVVAELPGLNREDIDVVVHENVLTISGERQSQSEEKDGAYRRREISRGSFKRSFTLPKTVEAEKIAASYQDGLLKIDFPKIEAAKPKRIEVTIK